LDDALVDCIAKTPMVQKLKRLAYRNGFAVLEFV